jgi:hypothetical protein
VRWFALLALAAGCGFPARPGQERAERLVWSAAFSAPGAPPPVEWREDDCGGPQVGARYLGECYAGIYVRDDHALVAWRGSIHGSSYAHELMHALQWRHGVEDPEHRRAEWSLVEAANRDLAASGL